MRLKATMSKRVVANSQLNYVAICHYHCRMEDEKPKQPGEKYVVRFPEGMRERIAQAAKLSGRSMNSEIVTRLSASFEQGDRTLPPFLEDQLREVAQSTGESYEEALIRAAIAGVSGGQQVFYLQARPGMTLEEIRTIMNAVRPFANSDAQIYYEMAGFPRTKQEDRLNVGNIGGAAKDLYGEVMEGRVQPIPAQTKVSSKGPSKSANVKKNTR
jgi:Arc-like DNA binding domain